MMNSESISDGGTVPNEDRVTITENAAWVLDGTSGATGRNLTGHPESDGVWYVDTIDEYLRTAISDSDRSLEQIICDAVEHVTMAYDTVLEQHSPTVKHSIDVETAVGVADIPGATIALVRWNTDTIEYFCLGDSVALFDTSDTLERVFHGDPEQFDATSRDKIATLQKEHPDESRQKILDRARPHIQSVRQLRETPGGYWTLGMNPLCVRFADTGEYSKHRVETVYLYTDGFDPLVELFDVFDSWGSAVEFINTNGLATAVEKLRTVESADSELTMYPRLKVHDDIAIAKLDFEQ